MKKKRLVVRDRKKRTDESLRKNKVGRGKGGIVKKKPEMWRTQPGGWKNPRREEVHR